MNTKYNVKNIATGLFLIVGKGFVASTQKDATAFTYGDVLAQLNCAKTLGISVIYVEVPKVKSYAVVYIRKGEGARLAAGLGKDPANPAKGQVDPSKRRFATRDEADKHGSRFRTRRANAGDAEGSAGHEGFFVVESYDAVNSAVNWKTGLTNSL